MYSVKVIASSNLPKRRDLPGGEPGTGSISAVLTTQSRKWRSLARYLSKRTVTPAFCDITSKKQD